VKVRFYEVIALDPMLTFDNIKAATTLIPLARARVLFAKLPI